MSEARIRRILDVSRSSSPFHGLSEHGFSPEEIKATVVEVLEPYFESRHQLVAHAVSLLGNEAINLIRIRDDPPSHESMKAALEIYRRAKSTDSRRCFQ